MKFKTIFFLGLGVFTNEFIPKNQIITVYNGEYKEEEPEGCDSYIYEIHSTNNKKYW